jgi:hypothetical protein
LVEDWSLLLLLCEREVLRVRAFSCCKIFSWVRRSTLQLGAQGGEIEKREGEEDLQDKCADRTMFSHNISRNPVLWM